MRPPPFIEPGVPVLVVKYAQRGSQSRLTIGSKLTRLEVYAVEDDAGALRLLLEVPLYSTIASMLALKLPVRPSDAVHPADEPRATPRPRWCSSRRATSSSRSITPPLSPRAS